MDQPYSKIVRWGYCSYLPNNGRPAKVNFFRFSLLIDNYYLDVSAVPSPHRAGEG